jgi:hypothetical protein
VERRSQEFEWAHVWRKGVGHVVIWPAFRSNSTFKQQQQQQLNIPGTRMVLVRSITCEYLYLREPPTCDTPVETNLHIVHPSDLATMSQYRLVDIRRRLILLPTVMRQSEDFMVEVYKRLISIHTFIITRIIGKQ